MSGIGATSDDDRAVLVLTSTIGRTVRTNHVALPADLMAPRIARRWLGKVLDEWQVPEAVASDAQLCLSEVVTNE